jgi:hypothetical protein
MRRSVLFVVVWCIVLAGGVLRLHYARTMPTDWDEDDYMVPAGMFRRLIDQGDWSNIPDMQQNYEHPPLVKLLYSLTIPEYEVDDVPTENVRFDNRIDLPPDSLRNARLQSVLAGTLTILAMGWVSPLAGLALAFQSIHVHFSSVAYLDALPVLFATLAVICYERGGLRHRWLWLSAACLGIAVAAKYPYAVVGVAMLVHALLVRHVPVRRLLAWGVIALGVFFLLNPYLWPAPVDRLDQQLRYHRTYSQQERVQQAPVKALIQMVTPGNHLGHLLDGPGLFAITDRVMLALAVPGVVALLWRRSVYGVWAVLGFAFLMIWPTQWIQHNMLIVVPYSVAAGMGGWMLARLALTWLASQGVPVPVSSHGRKADAADLRA